MPVQDNGDNQHDNKDQRVRGKARPMSTDDFGGRSVIRSGMARNVHSEYTVPNVCHARCQMYTQCQT